MYLNNSQKKKGNNAIIARDKNFVKLTRNASKAETALKVQPKSKEKQEEINRITQIAHRNQTKQQQKIQSLFNKHNKNQIRSETYGSKGKSRKYYKEYYTHLKNIHGKHTNPTDNFDSKIKDTCTIKELIYNLKNTYALKKNEKQILEIQKNIKECIDNDFTNQESELSLNLKNANTYIRTHYNNDAAIVRASTAQKKLYFAKNEKQIAGKILDIYTHLIYITRNEEQSIIDNSVDNILLLQEILTFINEEDNQISQPERSQINEDILYILYYDLNIVVTIFLKQTQILEKEFDNTTKPDEITKKIENIEKIKDLLNDLNIILIDHSKQLESTTYTILNDKISHILSEWDRYQKQIKLFITTQNVINPQSQHTATKQITAKKSKSEALGSLRSLWVSSKNKPTTKSFYQTIRNYFGPLKQNVKNIEARLPDALAIAQEETVAIKQQPHEQSPRISTWNNRNKTLSKQFNNSGKKTYTFKINLRNTNN
jgi:hypothetical protein